MRSTSKVRLAVVAVLLVACGQQNDSNASGGAGPSVGGQSSQPSGGTSAARAGASSTVASGGSTVTAQGGSTATTTTGLTASGGTVLLGGATSTGGTTQVNSTTVADTGGTRASGGTSSTASATTATATTPTGGVTATGGKSATGGRTASGGSTASGGTTATGSSKGGASTGGRSSGGSTGTTVATGGSTASSGGTSAAGTTGTDRSSRCMLLRDEGLRTLSYVNLGEPSENWYVRVQGEEAYPADQGRDLQLVGDGRVMVGTPNGYEEYLIADGSRVARVTAFPGTLTAHRLRNRNTLLASLSTSSPTNILLKEVDAAGSVVRTITYNNYSYVRLVRQTASGNFLMTSNKVVLEGRPDGSVAQTFTVSTSSDPHSWMALRMQNGDTVVSAGYGAALMIFASDGSVRRSLSGPSSVSPSFYAGFQILPNGNFVVANWQGHGTDLGAKGGQVLEYTPSGTLAWSWQQDASHFSSIQGVIVLDGLDLSKLHVEDTTGELVPVD